MMRSIVLLCLLLAGHNLFAQKPNIVIIYLDDMGYGDIEPYGMTGVRTPHFNLLAAQGLRLTNFNVAQAVCSASRAALLTGCYPNRVGISGAIMPGSRTALDPEEKTLASLLKSNGYTTAMLGKWHLGNHYPYLPLQYGFESFYGLPYSHDIWPVDYQGQIITDTTNVRSTWPPLPVIEGNNQIDSITTLSGQSQWTQSLTKRAVAFINKSGTKPFFLYLAHPLPHVPLAVSEKFKGRSKLGLFGDVIMELDWSLGEVMKALDDKGIAENTILIVTSDNGPWTHFGNHAGSSGGLKEGKGTPFEGGTRVPFLIRWPGQIQAGSVSGELMTNFDLLPTLCAITASPLPEKKIDGIDCSGFLLGKRLSSPRELFYYYYGVNNLMAIRFKHWKLVLPHQSQSYVRGRHGKNGVPGVIKYNEDKPLALYDLAHDPGEAYDVKELYPEMVKAILDFAEEARRDLGDDLTNQNGSNRRSPAILR